MASVAPERAATIRQRWESAPVPQRLSTFWKFIVDDEGFIWIRPYEPMSHAFAVGGRVGAGGLWTVLSPEGVQVGSVAVPRDIEPFEITSNAVLGIARDELGVESVRVYALRRQ